MGRNDNNKNMVHFVKFWNAPKRGAINVGSIKVNMWTLSPEYFNIHGQLWIWSPRRIYWGRQRQGYKQLLVSLRYRLCFVSDIACFSVLHRLNSFSFSFDATLPMYSKLFWGYLLYVIDFSFCREKCIDSNSTILQNSWHPCF